MKKKIIILWIFLSIFILTPAVFADQIEVQSGETVRGEVQNQSLRLKTTYAELDIQSQYINKINRENGNFVFRASENNRFSGELLSEIIFLVNGEELVFSASEIESIDFSNNDSFNANKQISVSLRNDDFFSANTVEDSININTSLGSPLNISYENIVSIEYLSEKDIYLIKRSNASDIESDLSGEKVIIWPAAGEIFELEFDYVRKIIFN